MTIIKNFKSEINAEVDEFSFLFSAWLKKRVYVTRIKKIQPEVSEYKMINGYLSRKDHFFLKKVTHAFFHFRFNAKIKSFVLVSLYSLVRLKDNFLPQKSSLSSKRTPFFEYFKKILKKIHN
jgi:hypothetical protein